MIETIAERVLLALLTLVLIAVIHFAGLELMPCDACTARLGGGQATRPSPRAVRAWG